MWEGGWVFDCFSGYGGVGDLFLMRGGGLGN